MADDFMEKFRLTEADKERIREAYAGLIERQFEAMETHYMDIFRKLPAETLESMSPQDAARYIGMVVQEAAEGISRGAALLQKEVADISRDEERMSRIRKSFLDSLGFKEAGA